MAGEHAEKAEAAERHARAAKLLQRLHEWLREGRIAELQEAMEVHGATLARLPPGNRSVLSASDPSEWVYTTTGAGTQRRKRVAFEDDAFVEAVVKCLDTAAVGTAIADIGGPPGISEDRTRSENRAEIKKERLDGFWKVSTKYVARIVDAEMRARAALERARGNRIASIRGQPEIAKKYGSRNLDKRKLRVSGATVKREAAEAQRKEAMARASRRWKLRGQEYEPPDRRLGRSQAGIVT
jgi:hypothetical protein